MYYLKVLHSRSWYAVKFLEEVLLFLCFEHLCLLELLLLYGLLNDGILPDGIILLCLHLLVVLGTVPRVRGF